MSHNELDLGDVTALRLLLAELNEDADSAEVVLEEVGDCEGCLTAALLSMTRNFGKMMDALVEEPIEVVLQWLQYELDRRPE
jgi:hypothetical protein